MNRGLDQSKGEEPEKHYAIEVQPQHPATISEGDARAKNGKVLSFRAQ
jgi:hypothetical protein